jgi:hypothetical protein
VELSHYSSYERYITVVDLEIALLNQARHTDFRHVLMIGSGPLPMTVILLAQRFGIHVDCLDVNPEACTLSREVIQALGLDQQVRVLQSDIRDFKARRCLLGCISGNQRRGECRNCTPPQLHNATRTNDLGAFDTEHQDADLRAGGSKDLIGFRICPALSMPPELIQSDFLVEKA